MTRMSVDPTEPVPLGDSTAVVEALPVESLDPLTARRADVDAKQAVVGRVLEELGCEAAVLLMPAHVAWFCGGFNVRGLTADTERPGVYTTGRARWLVCANADTQRLFDEELDRLGFQLKEWQWSVGRAVLLGELVAGKKVANPADVRSALSEAQKDGKRSILLRVKSGEATKFVALRLGKA